MEAHWVTERRRVVEAWEDSIASLQQATKKHPETLVIWLLASESEEDSETVW